MEHVIHSFVCAHREDGEFFRSELLCFPSVTFVFFTSGCMWDLACACGGRPLPKIVERNTQPRAQDPYTVMVGNSRGRAGRWERDRHSFTPHIARGAVRVFRMFLTSPCLFTLTDYAGESSKLKFEVLCMSDLCLYDDVRG